LRSITMTETQVLTEAVSVDFVQEEASIIQIRPSPNSAFTALTHHARPRRNKISMDAFTI
jgi:hypothetical protein